MKLEVKDLRKSFGETEVLHGVSFSVESGRALGLLGRNGAGKTTTIRILMDVFKANSGSVTMDGMPFLTRNYQIGYLPEERGLYPKKTVGEQLVYLAMLRGSSAKEAKAQMKKWLERMGVSEYENRKLETLSKGNQQKVQLAQSLLCNPELVFLDEPFSGLDPVNAQILKDVIKEQIAEGKLVVFSSHQIIAVILPVIHFISSKWHISDCHIEEIIRIICLLKTFNLDIGIWVKQFCNSTADTVQFHTIEF